ncbi:hypothetical protein Y695_04558 [Hydrogenophaga sp. T4]|nr:hypothetical protein Y695_04558 [Hydrogenophaga sp. T4]
MSKASVDLPEPLTPEITLNWPRGMSTLRFLRLCSLALTMRMALLWPAVRAIEARWRCGCFR